MQAKQVASSSETFIIASAAWPFYLFNKEVSLPNKDTLHNEGVVQRLPCSNSPGHRPPWASLPLMQDLVTVQDAGASLTF